ncbi:MAG: hypothetical protein Kow0010_17970 [Dehalococcoidia bacterium]
MERIIPAGVPAGGTAMPGAIKEWLRLLREHHVDHMPEERKVLLIARCCGVKVSRLADVRHKSVSAVQRELDLARAAIFDPTGLDRDWCLATWWVVEHRACCLGAAFSLVENSGELTG